MTPKSIKSHLKPYSIEKKRRTTIAHAFASALAPSDTYDKKEIEEALERLGQTNLKKLACVYCGKSAQTWDHLTNLVKAGEFNGYGHQIGNLVPCCRDCNSSKGSLAFEKYVDGLALKAEEKDDLKDRLRDHQKLAKEVDSAKATAEEIKLLKEFRAIQDKVLKLLEEGDKCAQKIRNIRNY